MAERWPANHERRRQFNEKNSPAKTFTMSFFISVVFYILSATHYPQPSRKVFFREVAQAHAQSPFPKLKTVFDLVNTDLTIFCHLDPPARFGLLPPALFYLFRHFFLKGIGERSMHKIYFLAIKKVRQGETRNQTFPF